ncbi:MAG: hypothetical protein KF752_02230 [Pirellulaceae bacterium]|nr:hypothetical protein [Pirellulaceae bacterium]
MFSVNAAGWPVSSIAGGVSTLAILHDGRNHTGHAVTNFNIISSAQRLLAAMGTW